MAGRSVLRPLREREDQPHSQREADALLVFGLPGVLLGQDGHRNAAVEDSATEVGDRDRSHDSLHVKRNT